MQIKKTTIIIIIGLVIALGFIIFSFSYKTEKATEGLVFTRTFKNGLDPSISKEKYVNLFKEIQGLSNVPIKYPAELPKNYKLFKINAWKKEGRESVEIYYGIEKTLNILDEYNSFKEKYEPTDIPPEKNSPLDNDAETILLKEDNIKPPFEKWGLPKESKLEDKKTAYLWTFSETETGGDFPYKKNLYFGYTKRNEKKYYYMISSNIEEGKILEVTNSIIENEKNILREER